MYVYMCVYAWVFKCKNIVYKHYVIIYIAYVHALADCIRMSQMSPSGGNIVDTLCVK